MYRDDDWHDTMQVCINGHKITEYAESQPQSTQKFCAVCGAKTITECPGCSFKIQGYRHIAGVFYTTEKPVPRYCINCGEPFPWQEGAVASLNEILAEGNLEAQDLATAKKALPDVLRDTPRTEVAALKLKGILAKLGKPLYDVAVKVVADIASETAKKSLGLK